MDDKSTILIAGLGNPILGDDGAGIYAARRLRRILQNKRGIVFEEICTGSMDLIDILGRYETIILIDAIITGKENPGHIYRFDISQLESGYDIWGGQHHINIRTAFDIAKKLAYPLPSKILIYAIEIDPQVFFSRKLTPRIRKSVERLTNLVISDLAKI